MKKNTSLFWSIASVLLCAASAFLGGGAFAMADVNITDVPDPANPDSKGWDTQLETGATATHVTETGFNDEEIEQVIANFRPFNFPLEYDAAKNARQSKASQYEVIHYRSGVNTLEETLLTELTTDTNMEITITGADVSSGTVNNFPEYADIIAPGVDGENGQDVAMFVKACNPSTKTALLYVYNCTEPVTLPEGTKLLLASYACSESQMIVNPDNYQPVPVTVYLQKKNANIVFTDEWLEIAKKAKFVLDDLQDNALYNYKRKMARTRWLGSPAKFKVTVGNMMGDEYVYHEEGVIRQLTMFYAVPTEGITQADLNAIAKMQFTLYAANTNARAYCGRNFIEKMLNIPAHIERGFFFETKTEAGMIINSWKNNFGVLDFVYDPTLDDIGYEDFCVVLDIRNATHYVKRSQRQDVQDMKKGTGDVREAKRYIYSQIDALALKGYNSILVGPSDKIAVAQALSNISSFSTSVSSLDDAAQTRGTIYYLTEDDNTYGFAKGTLVTWDNMWVEYRGTINA